MVRRMPESAIYRQIAEDLRARIQAGEFLPGQRLGSEAALAHEYRVAAPTIGMALAILRADGLLEPAVPGRVAVVREQPPLRDVVYQVDARIVGRPATVEDAALDPDSGIEPGVPVLVVTVQGNVYVYRQSDSAINFYVPK